MSSTTKFNVAYIKLSTKTEGPYNRCCIWFQGCNINCKGCANKDLQPLTPKHILTEEQLCKIVFDAKEKFGIEGVTLSGGEPSLQVGLVGFNKCLQNYGLGIIMFSGKTKPQLNPELVDSVDLLIEGPFVESSKDDKRILLGSTNKKLTFVTDRYKCNEDYFYNQTSIEEVTAEDYIFINGD